MEFTIHRYESVTSTNDVAIRMAEEGAPEGTVVIASEQTAGRGRHGRRWSSPAGSGLYLSVVFRPPLALDHLWQIGFMAAVASAEAISRVSQLSALVKWPNDVLLNERKVCGILTEARSPAAGGRSPVIVGIGVNVNTLDFPPEIARMATSLALETGVPIAVEHVEHALLECLGTRYEQLMAGGFGPILGAWKTLDCTAGHEVTVHTPEGEVCGTAQGVDCHGNLVVRQSDGSQVSVASGEVVCHISDRQTK